MYEEILKLLHFTGFAFGLGGSTLAFLLSKKAGKEKNLAGIFPTLLPIISKYVWSGLFLLIISGLGMVLLEDVPQNLLFFVMKMIIVSIILLGGLVIANLNSKLTGITNKKKVEVLKIKSRIRKLQTITLICWYLALIFSVII